MTHALLNASSAERWLNCTPSARLTEHIKDTSSIYAAEGTLAHKIGELILVEYFEALRDKRSNESEAAWAAWNKAAWEEIKTTDLFYDGMIDEVSIYTDYVIEQYNVAAQKTRDSLIYLEEKLDFSKYVPQGFGTGDCIIIADGQMEIIDLKFGKGVEVSAVNNPQLMLYALGAYEKFNFIYDIQTIKTTIAQVRLNHISSSSISTDMLLDWAEKTAKPAAKLAYEGKGELAPGNWCKFCKIRADCQARADKNLAFIQAYKDKQITLQTIADILGQADEISSWISDIKDNALAKALEGVEIPGYKVVEGRSNRQITDDLALAEVLSGHIDSPEQIWKPKALETITKLEKLFGKKRFGELAKDYIIKPPGKPVLVPNSDKRPAINSPENDFDM
jgi:hypothetical protein